MDFSVSAGYRDNLLLSPTSPERSFLLRAELEAMALKTPVGAFQGYAFLDLAETRYLSGENTDRERTAILAAEARWEPDATLRAGWSLQAYHHDQVLDVSITETELSTAQLRITGFVTGPNLRWNPAPVFLEARLAGRRDTYARDLDGYVEAEAAARCGYAFSTGAEIGLGATHRLRNHDSRPQHTASGRPLAGTRLKITQTDLQLDWTGHFDAAKNYRAVAAIGRQQSRDNGTGYFDYDRDYARAGFTAKFAPWEAQLGLDYNRYVFPVQFVGIGIDPDRRRKSELRASLELTRRLGERTTLFLVAERERSISNDDRSRFTVHTVHAGLKLSWDSLAALLPSS